MKPVEHSNTAVLDALGIPYKDQGIVSVSIHLRQCYLPTVKIKRFLGELGTGAVEGKRFTLTVIDEEPPQTPLPLDFAAMARAARERLARFINTLGEEHLQAYRRGHSLPWRAVLADEYGQPIPSASETLHLELGGLL